MIKLIIRISLKFFLAAAVEPEPHKSCLCETYLKATEVAYYQCNDGKGRKLTFDDHAGDTFDFNSIKRKTKVTFLCVENI